MFVNQPFHFPYRMWRNGTISGQSDGIKPELALAICTTDVNVRRLDAFIRVKVKTKTTDSKHCGHPFSVLPARYTGKADGSDRAAYSTSHRNTLCATPRHALPPKTHATFDATIWENPA